MWPKPQSTQCDDSQLAHTLPLLKCSLWLLRPTEQGPNPCLLRERTLCCEGTASTFFVLQPGLSHIHWDIRWVLLSHLKPHLTPAPLCGIQDARGGK